jgi:hypothetical protein
MTQFTYKTITYRELKDGSYKNAYIPQESKFKVTSLLTENLRQALIACPGNMDDSKTFMRVCVDEENKEIGRTFGFGTRIKAGENIYAAQTGCGFEVVEEYRKEGVGADLMMMSLYSDEYDFTLAAGISLAVLPMYRKLKYHLFEVPQYYKVRSVRYAFRSLRLKSWIYLGRYIVRKFKDIPDQIQCNRLKKRFVIKKENIVPEWVTEMVANDGHRFMEVHDRDWFQWDLDFNTYGYEQDIQAFYSIFDKSNKPMGFFMTKERIIKKQGPNNGFVIGTVVEWESIDKSVLSETDINLLAIHSFSKNVDVIFTLACESDTANQLMKMGFIERATFKVGVKDKKKQLKDIGNKDLWRLRYGMTNMIIL